MRLAECHTQTGSAVLHHYPIREDSLVPTAELWCVVWTLRAVRKVFTSRHRNFKSAQKAFEAKRQLLEAVQ